MRATTPRTYIYIYIYMYIYIYICIYIYIYLRPALPKSLVYGERGKFLSIYHTHVSIYEHMHFYVCSLS